MTNSQRLATIRSCFLCWIADQRDAVETDPRISNESVLIRDEFYCGRRLVSGKFHAVWFIEEDELKIFQSGELACVLSGAEIDQHVGQADQDHPAVLKMPQVDEGRTREDDNGDKIRRAA